MAFDRKNERHYRTFLEQLGCHEIEIIPGKKHVKVKWTTQDGRKQLFYMAKSPGDWRNERNNESGMRRLINDSSTFPAPAAGYKRTGS